MSAGLLALLVVACGACAPTQSSVRHETVAAAGGTDSAQIEIPASAVQGSLLFGHVPPGSKLLFDETPVRIGSDGRFVIGVARERTGSFALHVSSPEGATVDRLVTIVDRSFPVEQVNGVPEATVNPPPEIAARIEREQAEVSAVRQRDDDRNDFEAKFIWPVLGRISGVFGSQRIYNGTPKSPHSGLDIAARQGTAIQAPAAGIVTFANPDLYLTGGTVVIDHGHGVSSNFLHMSRIDVSVGERVEQGQVIGLVGATGRATGPHMHWGMNWFGVRVDPQLLVDPAANPQ
jgi:murein DD-endopeptidase MepM/ murein hydrolase activator NlpD